MIPVETFTTSHLPSDERYKAWLSRDWPRTRQIYRTVPTEPFDITMQSAALGQVLLVRTEITAMTWERRTSDIRDSDFQPIIVNLMVEGRAQGDMDGRAFVETSGTYHFHDLARPSLHASSASLTYAIVAPRPVAAQCFPHVESLHGFVVGGEDARAAINLIETVWSRLSDMPPAVGDRYARAILELLAAGALTAKGDHGPEADEDASLRRAVIDAIDLRLGLAQASASTLAQEVGAPAERLAAVFRADGGLRSYLLSRRLDEARAALVSQEPAEPVGTIAHRLGFADAAHLSRAFRSRFGLSPREYRLLGGLADAED